MAGSVNKVLLLGHLGGDPDIRSTQDGRKVATFSVATSERWRDKASGEQREATEWHRVVVFNEGLVGVVEQFLKKGSKVYVEGALRTRKWTDAKSIERYSTEVVLAAWRGEIVLCDRAERAPGASSESDYGRPSGSAAAGGASAPPSRKADFDDDIPF